VASGKSDPEQHKTIINLEKIMTKTYKLTLLAALGLASVTAAKAQYVNGDLLVGVYQPGVANTTVLDLGSFSSIYTSSQTWNLSSALAAAGFGSTLSSSATFGVVGESSTGTTAFHAIYETVVSPSTPPTFSGAGAFNGIKTDVVNIGNLTAGPGTSATLVIPNPNVNANSGDWYSQTVNYVANQGGITLSSGVNPAATVGTSDILYKTTANNTAPTSFGKFDLNPTTEQLSYTAAAVPEPATYGMIAGLGLLAFSLRNQFRGKQAKKA